MRHFSHKGLRKRWSERRARKRMGQTAYDPTGSQEEPEVEPKEDPEEDLEEEPEEEPEERMVWILKCG